jgi:hypothetical protein
VQLNAAVMLGRGGDSSGIAELLGGYEALVDELLGGDEGDSNWIGTEEDILMMMMQRDGHLFTPVRSGTIRYANQIVYRV